MFQPSLGALTRASLSARIRVPAFIEFINNVACSLRSNPVAVCNLLFTFSQHFALSVMCLHLSSLWPLGLADT